MKIELRIITYLPDIKKNDTKKYLRLIYLRAQKINEKS